MAWDRANALYRPFDYHANKGLKVSWIQTHFICVCLPVLSCRSVITLLNRAVLHCGKNVWSV